MKKKSANIVAVMALVILSGCTLIKAPNTYQASHNILHLIPVEVIRQTTGPMSYQSEISHKNDTDKPLRQIKGRACQSGFQLPLFLFEGWRNEVGNIGISAGGGDGGFRDALNEASESMFPGETMFDIQADINTINILGVWRQKCLVVTGWVGPKNVVLSGASGL